MYRYIFDLINALISVSFSVFSRSELRLNVEDNIFPNNFPFSSSVLKSWLFRNGLLDRGDFTIKIKNLIERISEGNSSNEKS
ncbi:hypothetical protein BpHYR1_026781 [Brachionus plicatilis]|uniref:Uncharacterized protein n=1 Tax=Brachionus plicatilis TaxID=10195 RepID=A0A3M7Q456_BRAPC|nr:hypothetical protein BpHYR1_026781 [Brachionus plicatilis]